MQDLDVIIRQNARAEEEFANKEAAAGKWVVARYTGLNYHSYKSFDNERDRNAAAIEWNNDGIGRRTRLINPAAEAVAA